MTALLALLRCRLLGHLTRRFTGTFYVACDRCGVVGRLDARPGVIRDYAMDPRD